MSATEPLASPRQWLTSRQGTTVNALLDAGIAEIRDLGYEHVTIRGVAKRAGVTHTTAYSYFASKEHLVAELHWRQLQSLPAATASEGASLLERVRVAFEAPTAALAAEPELSSGVLVAMMGDDPDIRRVRELTGRELARRLATALEPADDPSLVEALLIAYIGATLLVRTLDQDYTSVLDRLESLVRRIDPSGGVDAVARAEAAVTGPYSAPAAVGEARAAIEAVLVRYARAVDTRDWACFRSCFTKDVAADYGDLGAWQGIEALTEFMIEGHLGMGPTQHRLTNFEIAIEGDRAEARSYVHAVTVLASHPDDWIDTIGTYDDLVVRQAGEWRIARRTFRITRMVVSPSLSAALPATRD